MKHVFTFLVLALLFKTSVIRAQYCANDNRFTQVPYFAAGNIKIDSVIYATNVLDWQGNSRNLKMTIFRPKNAVENLAKRPMVMVIHGGAFISGNRYQCDSYCMAFAQRGFVAVTIDYRLGKEMKSPCSDPLSQEKAVYRALQDAHAAMRYLVANASTYRIDTDWLFAGGYSAGAGTALGLVYMQQAEANQVYPTIMSQLGNINSSGNAYTNIFQLKGIFNNWGGVSSDFFDLNEAVPTISFHGGQDPVVPVDSALDVTCTITNHYIYGSYALYTKTKKKVCNDVSINPGGLHGVWQTNAERTKRINRATCFFRSLFCSTCANYLSVNKNLVDGDCAPLVATGDVSDTLMARLAADEALSFTASGISNLSFRVYPNPASSEIWVNSDSDSPITVFVSNQLGDLILTSDKRRVDVSQLANGVYVVAIHDANGEIARKKLVVQH